jgi:hypothetical protein
MHIFIQIIIIAIKMSISESESLKVIFEKTIRLSEISTIEEQEEELKKRNKQNQTKKIISTTQRV